MTLSSRDQHRPVIAVAQLMLMPLLQPLADQLSFELLAEMDDIRREAVEIVAVLGNFPFGEAEACSLPNLKLVACFNVGFEAIDAEWLRANGIAFHSDPGSNAGDVADHVIGSVLLRYRRLMEGDAIVRAEAWPLDRKIGSTSLRGLRIGIIGLGHIGREIASRAECFGMVVQWWGPHLHSEVRWSRALDLSALVAESDVLVVACPPQATNKPVISRELLEQMPAHAMLVNVARGELIDEVAVRERLRSGALGFAALDVFQVEPPDMNDWRDVPNTLLTPHMAGVTPTALTGMRESLLASVLDLYRGRDSCC